MVVVSGWYVVAVLLTSVIVAVAFAVLIRRRTPPVRPSLIDGLPDAIFVCDAAGGIVTANGRALRMIGEGGRSLTAVFPALEPLVAAATAERPVNVEVILSGPDDRRYDSRVLVTCLGEEKVVVLRDLSERRRQQREVLEALTVLDSALSSTADGILVVTNEGRIVSYNERFTEMWSVGRELLESADEAAVYAALTRQIAEPRAAARPEAMILHDPQSETFTILRLRDERRVEASSIGRDLGDGKSIRVWSFRDVTARFTAEAALRESELRYRLLFEQNAAGVCAARPDGTIIDCNATFAATLAANRADLVGSSLRDSYARPVEFDELMAMLRDSASLSSVEVELRDARRAPVWVLQNLVLIGSGDSAVVHATLVDISDRKRAEEQIEFHAYHDVLTHLPNRRLFGDRLRQSVTRARRTGRPMAVLFIDLDRFKEINDTLGHTAGDELLLEMSRRLKACVREDDTVGRLGGDEFTVILSDLRQPEDAVAVAQKILDTVQQPMLAGGLNVEVTASIGIALFPTDGNDPESLLRNADSAMYRAKELGRNNFHVCTDEMKQRAVERLSLEERLRNAVHQQQLALLFQPQVSLGSGRIIAVEALVRWNDPERGVIEPVEFIPIAEESRLILAIDAWVLRAACRQMGEWLARGLDPVRIAVNVSTRQLQQSDFVDLVRGTLHEFGIAPEMLDLEFTAAVTVQSTEDVAEVFRELRELGVGVVIDDFGSSYSSIAVLKRLPITAVKIDRALIGNAESTGDAALTDAIIRVARGLVLRSIAEGVQTDDELAFLQQMRCDAAQGFLISPPVAAEAIAAILAGEAVIPSAARREESPDESAAGVPVAGTSRRLRRSK